MDKLTFCNNYLYSCGQVISLVMSVCLRRYVCGLCLYVKMEAMRDGSS
jgi:ribosomal protein S27AE